MRTKLLLLLNLLFFVTIISCKKDLNIPLEASFESDLESTVAGGKIIFSDKSKGSPSKWNWTFEGGTPATSELSSPEVSYEIPGTYAVTLEVTNAAEASTITKQSFITVGYNTVVAEFESDKTTAVQNESIQFTDKSTGLPGTWLWEFIPQSGATITSTERNPLIEFVNYGIYTVKLTASNPEYSNQVIKTDYINILDKYSVEAKFTSEAVATYAGGSIKFNDASIGNAASWSWSFEGGTPAVSTEQHPTITYNTPGRYKVTLTTSNASKSSDYLQEKYILVIPSQALSGFFPFNGNASDAGPFNLSSSTTGTITFDGTDRNNSGSKTAAFNGTSYVMIPDNEACNFETGNYTIAVWIKTSSTKKMMVWQESGKNGSKDNQTWLRMNDNLTTPQYLRFAIEDATGGGSLAVGNPGYITDNKWHHVVCVREGTNTKMYVDGVKMTTEVNASGLRDVSNENGFKIGAQEGLTAFASYFTGELDDVIIYKRAFTAAEVLELFNL